MYIKEDVPSLINKKWSTAMWNNVTTCLHMLQNCFFSVVWHSSKLLAETVQVIPTKYQSFTISEKNKPKRIYCKKGICFFLTHTSATTPYSIISPLLISCRHFYFLQSFFSPSPKPSKHRTPVSCL